MHLWYCFCSVIWFPFGYSSCMCSKRKASRISETCFYRLHVLSVTKPSLQTLKKNTTTRLLIKGGLLPIWQFIDAISLPVRAVGHNTPLIDFWFQCYIYCLLASPLTLYLHLFLTYHLPYLSFPLRTDLLHFQAGCRKRRLNLALVFLSLFCFVVHFIWLVNACFCCVLFFPYQAKTGLGKQLRNELFLCRVGRKTAAISYILKTITTG